MDAKWLRNSFVYLIILVAVMAILFSLFQGNTQPNNRPISEVLAQVQKDVASGITTDKLVVSGNKITADTTNGRMVTYKSDTDSVLQLLHNSNIGYNQVQVEDQPPSELNNWLGFIGGLAPIVIFGVLILFMMRQAQGSNSQALSFGKSRARMFMGNKPTATFNDVAGVDEAKQELAEIVEFLKFPDKFSALGARIPRGVLLIGPPGTGKTLLSRAVAGEAGGPFFSISGSEFVEMFVGVGASRVRDLFDQAKRNSPCIVFVDEIDAVGRQRGAGLGGSHDEREQTLNQILVEMDGFDTNTNVIVLAATNRPDVLDPALLRPGRFDRHVVLPNPDVRGRKEILEIHTRNKPLDKVVTLETLAKMTPGFSGADLFNLVNEGAILAARRNKKTIGNSELEEAIDRVTAGPERRSRVISEREKAITAYHEVGHALVARMLANCDPVQKISIVARGMMGGYTRFLPREDRYLWTRNQFRDNLGSLLGGHVSEKIVFGDVSTGAENDIERATNMSRKMVCEYGMSEKLGPRAFGHKEEMVFLGREISEQRNYSEAIAQLIDSEIKELIDNAYARAFEILTRHRDKLTEISEVLMKDETIDAERFEDFFRANPPQFVPAPVLG